MHLIGYWIRDLKDDEFCAPQEIVGSLEPDVRSKLADYLDASSHDVLERYCGYSWCRFFCHAPWEAMGSKELTDGYWAWPEGLSHYVRAHGILLPEEFISHALASRSLGRKLLNMLKRSGGSASLDYWRNWCAAHRSPAILKRLRRARMDADARAPIVARERIQARVASEVAQHGLGDERCIFAGCQERVLTGMKLCALHILRDTDTIANDCYQITPELLP